MALGRPSAYTPELCEKLLQEMSMGKSMVQFCALIGIHRDTFNEWTHVHPLFSDTYKQARELYEAFWESWLIQNIDNRKINVGLAKMLFANRFGWSDNQKIEQNVTTVDESKRAVREALTAHERDDQ